MKRGKIQVAEELGRAFREKGTRVTAARRAVWALFASSAKGYSVPEAAAALRRKKVGPATVYRTVDLLEKLGFLRGMRGVEGERRFIACRPGHYHAVVCRSCGQAVEFEGCDISILERLVAIETGYKVEGHYLEIYGKCDSCRGSGK